MRTFFYRFLTLAARYYGLGAVRWIARGVAAGYFFLFPARVAAGRRFYRALFADRNLFFALWCTWRQFQEFTHVFVDRLRLQGLGPLTYRCRGLEDLAAALAAGRGAVLLMSHLGNWEVAARLLKQRLAGLELLLFMGALPGEQIEGLQKDAVQSSGIRVVGVGPGGGSQLQIVEALALLRRGGFVSMAADLVWHPDQPTVAVDFLGGRVALPRAPFHLALASGAPLFVFFALREAPGRFFFTATPVAYATAGAADGRQAGVARAAQAYADLLADTLRRHPFQWHHFAPLKPAAGAESAGVASGLDSRRRGRFDWRRFCSMRRG